SPSGTTGPPTTTLTGELKELGFRVTTLPTGTAPTQAVIDAAVAAAEGKDAVIVATYNVTAGSAQQKLVRALAATGVPVVVLAI
ncbi:glycoside hydrolase family 3 protein, partial [Streptomyces fulvissimus]|nr:glycoside hydrolase family 3 protein [Streptomyces microflavus]